MTTGGDDRPPAPPWLRLSLPDRRAVAIPVSGWGGPLQALGILDAALRALGAPSQRVDALDPRLPVSIGTSVVGGFLGVGLAECVAVGVSPLSRCVGVTRSQGAFAARLRSAGIVGITVTGAAERPTYAVVSDARVTLVDASDLWGLDTVETTAALLARHGANASVAVIGPAGEVGTRYANVVTCGSFPLPRLGFGAALGARRLKAIVCVPSAGPAPVDAAGVASMTATYAAEMDDNPVSHAQHSLPGFGTWAPDAGDPGYTVVRNFRDTETAPADLVGFTAAAFAPHLTWSADGCPGCPNDCLKGYAGAALHQEAVSMLGPNLGIEDVSLILRANAECVRLGLDPVSAGGTLAVLFEASAAGPLPDEVRASLHGIEPAFGNAKALLPLLALAATAGHPLGEGAAALATRLGMPWLAMTSKDVELPPWDPRLQQGLGLAYAAAPSGPRYDMVEHDLDFDPELGMTHLRAEAERIGLPGPVPVGVLDVARTAQLAELWAGLDALLVCTLASTPTRPLHLQRVCELVEMACGVEIAPADVFALGRAHLTAQSRVNALLGVDPGRDTLPDRFFDEPVATGRFAGMRLHREEFAAGVLALAQRWGD